MSDTQSYVAVSTVTVAASQSDIWALWADVAGWPHWDDGLEKAEISGNFRAGTLFSLTPRGCANIGVRLTSVTSGEEFSDEAVLPFGTLRSFHRMEPVGSLIKLTHELQADVRIDASERFDKEIWPRLQAGLAVAVNNIVDIVQAD